MNSRLVAAACVSLLATSPIALAAEPTPAAPVVLARSEVASPPAAQAAVAPTPAAPTPSAAAAPSELQVVPAAANEPTTVIGPLPVKPASTATAAPAPAPVDDPNMVPGVSAADEDAESMVGTLFKTFLVLGMVVALIYVSLNYGLRKLMGIRGMPVGRSALVKVIERIPLDPRRTLFVIQAGGEYLLVGGGEEGLSLISKLDPTEVSRVLEQRTAAAAAPSAFLQKLLSRGATRAAQNPAPGTPPTGTARSGEIDKV